MNQPQYPMPPIDTAPEQALCKEIIEACKANQPSAVQEVPAMTIIDSSSGFDAPAKEDAGVKARMALVKAKAAAGVRRVWFWFKVLVFLALCGLVGFGYYAWTHLKVRTYVTDHRPCSIEAEDKSWKVTGTRSYTYHNNELFGIRWSEAASVQEKTELDVTTGKLMVGGAYEGGYWWQAVNPNTTRPIYLKPASLLIFMANDKMLITNNESFCK